MQYWPFLIAASETQEYDWVVLPDLLGEQEKMVINMALQKQEPNSGVSVIQVDLSRKISVVVASQTWPTLYENGSNRRDSFGRQLLHRIGVLAKGSDRLPFGWELKALSRSETQLKRDLNAFLNRERDFPVLADAEFVDEPTIEELNRATKFSSSGSWLKLLLLLGLVVAVLLVSYRIIRFQNRPAFVDKEEWIKALDREEPDDSNELLIDHIGSAEKSKKGE